MMTYEDALDLVRRSIPNDTRVTGSMETDDEYVFFVLRNDNNFGNGGEIYVDKTSGEPRQGHNMITFYELFFPDKVESIKKTIKRIEEVQ